MLTKYTWLWLVAFLPTSKCASYIRGAYFFSFHFQVSTDFVRLHIDGKMVGEKPMLSSLSEDAIPRGSGRIVLGNDGEDNNMQGYVHNAKVLPSVSSIRDHYAEVQWDCLF